MNHLRDSAVRAIIVHLMSFNDPIIGGSFGLYYNDLLSREPNDLDVFIPNTVNYEQYLNIPGLEVVEGQKGSLQESDAFGNHITRIGLKYRYLGVDISVCMFMVPKEQMKYTRTFIQPHTGAAYTVRLQLPMVAIESKRQYAEKYNVNPKHAKDLFEIGMYLGIGDALVPQNLKLSTGS
jgi:hypothetical protein